MRFFNKNIHWIVSLLIVLGTTVHVYMLHTTQGFTWELSVADAVCSMVTLSLSVWSFILLIRAYPTKVTIYSYALVLALAFALASSFAEMQVLSWWIKKGPENQAYFTWLRTTMPVRFALTWVFYTWLSTNAALRKNIQALNSRFQQHADAAELLRDAELFKLRQQLQPHFLYNSLNSISALVMISPDRAQEMVGKLSDFLRGSVRREAEDIIPIHEEIIYIESYLAIESVRFGDRLNIVFEKQFSEKATIPPFLFQPILENAIKFGLYGQTGQVTININIIEEQGMLLLHISNPFDPDSQPPKGTGFGLTGVGRRLYLLYSRTDLLETTKNENNFTTTLKIPQHHV